MAAHETCENISGNGVIRALPSAYYKCKFSDNKSEDLSSNFTRTQHNNNVPSLRGEKNDISLKILHQTGFETARQAAT